MNKEKLSEIITSIKMKAQALTKKQKVIVASAIVVIVILTIGLIAVSFGNGVEGKYNFYKLAIDGYGSLNYDTGYMEITGVNNDEISMIYFTLSESTCRMRGEVSEVRKFDDHIKYRFDVNTQSGTALEDLEFFYFYFYPDRGDHGIIEVAGTEGVTLYFAKTK
jgi:hypothetical protein